MPLYRHFETSEDLDAQYNLNLLIPRILDIIGDWAERGVEVRERIPCRPGLKFGPTCDEYLDLFPATEPGAPTIVFFHGGYWMAQNARHASLVAPSLTGAGVSVIVPNYSLCPNVAMDEIVRQAKAAVAWSYRHAAATSGGAVPELYLCGWSAGAQLAAIALMSDWPGEYGLPADIIKGVIGISGIYDLRPLRHTYIQPKVQLQAEHIERYSPIFHITDCAIPFRAIYGEAETDEFHRQSDDFLAQWLVAGNHGDRVVIANADHFAVIDALFDPVNGSASPILDWVFGS